MLDKKQVLDILKQYKSEHANDYGITQLGVFGSVARDDANENSDVDVVIQLKKPNLFALSNIRQELEERLKKHVDIIRVRDRMNQFLKEQIFKEAVYV